MAEDLTLLGKTEDEIKKEVLTVATEKTGIQNFKSTGVLRGLLETFSRVMATIYASFLSPIYKQTNLSDATGHWLSMWGLMLGVARKEATKTVGTIIVTAYQDGQLDAGTWVTVSGTTLRFKITADVAFSSGTFAASVEAEFPGATYNVVDAIGILTKVVAGIESISFGEDFITTAGTDEEVDDDYRQRILDKWTSQEEGNPPESFIYYATSVDGVKAVKLVRTPRGYGTVDVIVVAVNGVPTQTLLDDVYATLDSHALICNDLQVKAPGQIAAIVTIEFTSDSISAETVEQTVQQYVYGLGIGGKLEIREIYAALGSLGLDSVEVLAPTRDVPSTDDSIIVATVTATRL